MMIWPYFYYVKVHKEFRRKLYTIFLDFGILLNPCAYNRSNKPLNRKTNNKGVLYMQFTKIRMKRCPSSVLSRSRVYWRLACQILSSTKPAEVSRRSVRSTTTINWAALFSIQPQVSGSAFPVAWVALGPSALS